MPDRPQIVRTVAELRRLVAGWRSDGASVALVTTMGALHAGHIALVHDARSRAARTVVSIFVNPTQFGPNEDFAQYPRDEASDVGKLAEAGVDVVFAPAGPEIYPPGFATTVTVAGPADGLESDFRPHFFKGVATVVGKLLLSCLPDCAIFGEEDYQQLMVIKRMATKDEIADLRRGSVAWLEPLRGWIKDSVIVGESVLSPSLYDKKSSALKISGSNPLLKNRRIEFNPIPPSDALRASRKNFPNMDAVLCLSRLPGLNRGPYLYERYALPTELRRRTKVSYAIL